MIVAGDPADCSWARLERMSAAAAAAATAATTSTSLVGGGGVCSRTQTQPGNVGRSDTTRTAVSSSGSRKMEGKVWRLLLQLAAAATAIAR